MALFSETGNPTQGSCIRWEKVLLLSSDRVEGSGKWAKEVGRRGAELRPFPEAYSWGNGLYLLLRAEIRVSVTTPDDLACLPCCVLPPLLSNRPPAIAWAWGVLVWELLSVLSAWNHLPQVASLPHLCPKVSFSSVTSLTTFTVVFHLSFLCSAYHSHLPLLSHPENTFYESRLLPWGPALSSSGTEGDHRSAN